VASEGFLAVPANREKHVGDAQWAFHPKSGWKEKLLASEDRESTEESGGGSRRAYELTFENYRVAERWRWSVRGGKCSGKQVVTGGRVSLLSVSSVTVQFEVGTTRGYTCSCKVWKVNQCGNVVCEIVVTSFVRLHVHDYESDIMYYREKSCVLEFSDEMEDLNESDRSRCYIMCVSLYMLVYLIVCLWYDSYHNEECVEY
jgi:hypothetical protein